jgi:hypothetical protein
MTLARAGIALAVAGGVALGFHAGLRAKLEQRLDCGAWEQARWKILPDHGWVERWTWGPTDTRLTALANALVKPDVGWLWRAREMLAYDPEMVWALLPELRDPSFVGFRDEEDLTVEGRDIPLHGHRRIVRDDLFTRAGRASWLLKEVTGRSAGIVGVRTDPQLLADIYSDWQRWLESLDGGEACFPGEMPRRHRR